RKLELRLGIAHLVGEIERRGGRVEALKENLEERPGHPQSVDAIVAVLEHAHRYHELTDVLTSQAEKLEDIHAHEVASSLWAKVASLAEEQVHDVPRAIRAHERVVGLVPTHTALDALARLHLERQEPAAAARWLERRLSSAEPHERTHIAMRLADALVDAGDAPRAVERLERALETEPASPALRERLMTHYRDAGAH